MPGMMSSGQWQALFEGVGAVALVANMFTTLWLWRLRGIFVTRGEHNDVEGRIDGVRDEVAGMRTTIAGLFTNEKAAALNEKLTKVDNQNALLLGQLPGLSESIRGLSHQVNLLIENEFKQGR